MKKRIIKIGIPIIVIVAAVLVIWKLFFTGGVDLIEKPDEAKVKAAYNLLNESYLNEGQVADVYYTDFMASNTYSAGKGTYDANPENGITVEKYCQENTDNTNISETFTKYSGDVNVLEYGEVAKYNVHVNSDGLYNLKLDYTSVGSSLSDFTAKISINGKRQYLEMDAISLPYKWEDSDVYPKEFPVDGYGDEMPPTQKRVMDWYENQDVFNNTHVSTTPLCFYLEKGDSTIELQNVSSNGLVVGKLQVIGSEDSACMDYSAYKEKHKGEQVVSGADTYMEINAVDFVEKNSTQAIYGSSSNSALTPFDIDNDKLNTLTWTDPGTEITYKVNVKKTGLYKLAFHYQNEKEEFSAFQTIKIDNEVPFKEMYNYEFECVSSGWAIETLQDKDENPYLFYLDEGEHTITIKSEISPVMEAYRYALLIQKHVTDFQLEITKITGTDIDTDRAWKMTQYIKDKNGNSFVESSEVDEKGNPVKVSTIEQYLNAYQTLIDQMRYLLQDYSDGGNDGAVLSYLDKAETFIKNDLEYPDEIALHTKDLTDADNSILQAISSFTTSLKTDKFTLDMIYVYGDEDDLPSANQSIFSSAWIATKQLLNTFTSSKYSNAIDETDDQTVTVWVNKAINYVDLLQKMADTEFTPKTGIKVKVTTMPDVSKITLAVAANETPDVALGLQSYVPFDLSSRGALYDMTKFDDFWNVAARFPAGSFTSYVYNEGVYAIPETTDFSVVVYRKDIFDSLGIEECPTTWDGMIEILPTIQRYGMNFYHNISVADSSYKWFHQTAPLILQNGGKLYTDDGTKTAIDEKNSIKGLQVLGDLFTKYSLDTSVGSFFNNFRYATIPAGIIGMQDYTLIKNGAPDLEGKWAISPYLGTVKENGEIDNTFIANGTGGIIFGRNTGEPTVKQQNAWEFLKWWTSAEAQTEYAYTLRSTYGKTYFWLSANKEALQNVPMDEADKQIVLKQIENVTDITRTPGQYLLERTISNIWTTMVFDGTSAQIAVDEAVLEVNKEIKRKMKEFGFYDEDGNQIKPYVIRGKDWIEENQQKALAEGGLK